MTSCLILVAKIMQDFWSPIPQYLGVFKMVSKGKVYPQLHICITNNIAAFIAKQSNKEIKLKTVSLFMKDNGISCTF